MPCSDHSSLLSLTAFISSPSPKSIRRTVPNYFEGTYRLTDAGVLKLLACSPRLTGLEIPANSRISRKSLDTMVDAERPVGRALTSLSLVRIGLRRER